MLQLSGDSALSQFRRQKLQQQIEAAGLPFQLKETRFDYFLDTSRPFTAQETAKAEDLLSASAFQAPADSEVVLIVTPRLGTLSAWSTKASEIAMNCWNQYQILVHCLIENPQKKCKRCLMTICPPTRPLKVAQVKL